MKKRFISFLLAAIMVVTFLPVTAFAQSDVSEDHGFKVFKAPGVLADGVEIEVNETPPGNVDYYWQGDTLYIVKDELTVSGEGESGEYLFVGQGEIRVSSVTFKDLSTANTIYMRGPTNGACTLTLTFEGENKIGNAQDKPGEGIKFTGPKMIVTGKGSLTIFDKYDGILPGEGEDGFDLTFDDAFTGTLTVIDEGADEPEPESGPPCAISISNGALSVNGGTLNLISISKSAITANEVTIGGLVVYAGDSPETVEKVNPAGTTLCNRNYVRIAPESHCETINGNNVEFKPWLSIDTLPSSAGNWYLTNDVTLNETWNVPVSNAAVNLCLNGYVIDATSEGAFSAITVGSGATLNLYDCNTDGKTHYYKYSSTAAWEYIASPTDIQIASAVAIESITDAAEIVAISGGAITGGKGTSIGNGELDGGGVYIPQGGTLTMNSGTIVGCSATKGGGVFTSGDMTMNGNSAIIGCTATIDGGGVCACNCNFSMTDNSVVSACIAENGGGGVYTWSGTTPLNASFTMSGSSKIENCIAKYTYSSNQRSGGGLCVENSTLKMTGGTITGNKSVASGGGVCFMSGTVTLGGIANISKNKKGTLNGAEWTNLSDNNLYLPTSNTIMLGTDTEAPTTMSVGVTLESDIGIFTSGNVEDYSTKFTPDAGNDYKVLNLSIDSNKLKVIKEYDITYRDQGNTDFSGTHGANHPTKHTYGTETTLVSPTKTGYTFGGWYTSADCSGTAVTSLGAIDYTGDITLYAKWIEASPAPVYYEPTYYSVTSKDSDNGSFTVDRNRMYFGGTVTVTVTPDKGFILETLTVLDKNGKAIEVKDLGNNKYSFKMPSGKVDISASFMEDNRMLNHCVDVKVDDYYYDAVLWAYENEICKGIDELHFNPLGIASRAEMLTFLWRAAGSPEPKATTCNFTDVDPARYYYKAVLWAVENGITDGTSETTFSPSLTVDRAQTVTFLARYNGVKDSASGYSHDFTDVPENKYYSNAVAWAYKNKITDGTGDNKFSPFDNCQRGQVVTFLYRNFVK